MGLKRHCNKIGEIMQKQTLIMQGLVLYLIILVSCSRVLEPVTDEPTDMTPVIVTAVEQTATPPASTAVAPMATPHTAPNLLYNPGFDEACRHVRDSQCIPLGWEFTDNVPLPALPPGEGAGEGLVRQGAEALLNVLAGGSGSSRVAPVDR